MIKQDTPISEHGGFFQFFLVAASVYYDETERWQKFFLIDISPVVRSKRRQYEESYSEHEHDI
jgi:hypothetical protein